MAREPATIYELVKSRFVEQRMLFRHLGYRPLLDWSLKVMFISFIFVGFLKFLSDLPSQMPADVPIFLLFINKAIIMT